MAEGRTRPGAKEIKAAYDTLFNASLTSSKIKDAALGGRLFRAAEDASGVAGRSLAWKLFLVPAEPLQAPPTEIEATPPLEALRAARNQYVALLLVKMRAPDGSYEDGLVIPGTTTSPPRTEQSRQDLERNNPLSLDDQNPWTEWFASMDLRKTILQDVERTFPDIGYFRDSEVQAQLTNILFVHAVTHPDIGYRQGMHELLAPLYYAVDFDSVDEETADLDDQAAKEFCSRAWVAADAWALFSAVMQGLGRWYEWQEGKSTSARGPLASHIHIKDDLSPSAVKPYVSPIVEACNRIQSTYLKTVDPELWKSMQTAGIEPQIYGIRWLRLLFTREFDMDDSMVLWDGLFACDPSFDLAQWVCVAMLIRTRNKLIPSDYSGQLTYLLRYPPTSSLASPDCATPAIHHATLLLRQALALQMSPSPTTGVSVIHENRNLLNIPVEVPEPPPPPPRRRSSGMGRGQTISAGTSRGAPMSRTVHSRQQSNPLGLPEMFARNLLERGESLGINKTVMNAVSELKRNLPDLANSLARLPVTPPQTTYAAYPLVDERPPSERPPLEVRTRFEGGREAADLRAFQRQLGDSVGWIVDTLLQDEGNVDEERAKTIRNRKREALECLAYVRDVLKGTVTNVEEGRLVGEEELERRKAKTQQERERQSEVANRAQALPTPPKPVAPSPIAINSRPQGIARHASGPTHLPISHPTMASSPLKTVSITAPTPSVLQGSSPPNKLRPVAPWDFTRSDFGSRESPIATLPRVPPRTSTQPLRVPSATSAFTPLAPMSEQQQPLKQAQAAATRDQAPRREIQHDPLGVLR